MSEDQDLEPREVPEPASVEGEPIPAEPDAAKVDEAAEEEPIAEANDVDEDGVPYKNRYMEAKRKQEELEERLRSVEDRNYSKPPQPEVKPKVDPKEALTKFANDPEGFLDSYYETRKRKDELSDAIAYIREKGYDVKTIDNFAAEYNIAASPRNLVSIWERHQKKLASSKTPVKDNKKKEVARSEKLKETSVESKTKSASPTVDEISQAKKKFLDSGNTNDLARFFRQQLEKD